jgi:sulfite reductase beta subunit-like hemoprotein
MKFVLEDKGERPFRAAWLTRFERLRPTMNYEPEELSGHAGADIAEIMRHRPQGGWCRGVRPQRGPGRALVTVNVTLGDLAADELRTLAALTRLGDGSLSMTRNQNIQYRDVPVDDVGELRAGVAALGLRLEGADSAVDVRSCTGSAVCSLAITQAPTVGARLARIEALARNAVLRVNVSGCPNSCAQHQAADIGLAGAKVRIAGRTELGYIVFLGADLADGRVGEAIGRVAEPHVEETVSAIVGTWEALRFNGERLVDTLDRIGRDAFAAQVSALTSAFELEADPAAVA